MIRRGNLAETLRAVFFSNWKNKGVALFLALVVWAYAFGATQEEQSFSTDIELRVHERERGTFAVKEVRALRGAQVPSLDAGDPRFLATVRLKGPRRLLRSFTDAQLRGVVEVRNDSQEYDLVQALVIADMPQGVSIVSAEPALLRVLLEPYRAELRDIEGNSIGIPDPSFRPKARFDFVPNKVTLVGPESALAATRVVSEPIDLSELKEPVTERVVKIFVEGSDQVEFKADEKQLVTVKITLDDATEFRDIRVRVQFAIPPLVDRQVAIEAASDVVMRFQGTKAALDQLETLAVDKNSPFRLLYILEREDVSDDRVFSVLPDEFRWLQGEAPPGIRIVRFGDEISYTVSLSVKTVQATGN